MLIYNYGNKNNLVKGDYNERKNTCVYGKSHYKGFGKR